MSIKEAVVCRFKELMADQNLKANELAVKAGITPSTVYSMLDPNRNDISIKTIKKLCDGLGMSLAEFFSSELFNHTF